MPDHILKLVVRHKPSEYPTPEYYEPSQDQHYEDALEDICDVLRELDQEDYQWLANDCNLRHDYIERICTTFPNKKASWKIYPDPDIANDIWIKVARGEYRLVLYGVKQC